MRFDAGVCACMYHLVVRNKSANSEIEHNDLRLC